MIAIGIGAVLLHFGGVEKVRSFQAPSEGEATNHVKRARIYKVLGWALLAVFLLLPLAFVALWLLFPPNFM